MNLALKLSWLGVNELSNDEPFTVFNAQRSLHGLFAMLRTENNPPLFFLITHFWSRLVGLDVALLRVPSAIFSALTVWPLFLLVRSLSGRLAAITSALLFTLNNHHFGFAHEVRGYSLFVLLAVWSMWLVVRMARVGSDPGNGRDKSRPYMILIALAVANTITVYTHFFGWLMIGIDGLCVLLLKELRPARKAFLISVGCALLAYSPYALIFYQRASASVANGTWVSAQPIDEIYNMVWRWSNAPMIAVALLVVIAFVAVRDRAKHVALRIGLIWMLVPLIGLWFVQLIAPIYIDRYLVWASPGFYLLAGHALAQAVRHERARFLPPLVAIASMQFTFTPWKSNGLHPSRVMELAAKWRDGDGIVLFAPHFYDVTFAWHLDKTLYHDPEHLQQNLIERKIFPMDNFEHQGPLRETLMESVVLIDAWSALTDPDGTIKRALRERFPQVDSLEADKNVRVYRFRR